MYFLLQVRTLEASVQPFNTEHTIGSEFFFIAVFPHWMWKSLNFLQWCPGDTAVPLSDTYEGNRVRVEAKGQRKSVPLGS